MRILANLTVTGTLDVDSVSNAGIDTDRFLVQESSGLVRFRTGAEVLADIGAQGYLTLTTTGTSGASTLIGNTLNIPNYGSALTGYVPYTGATTNVDLGEYEIKAGQLSLDLSPTGIASVGTTRWNNTAGIAETTLKGGTIILKNGVDLVVRIVNKVTPNQTLTKAQYQAVKVSGAQGQRLAVELAMANNDNNSVDTIGIVAETIATNQEGFVITVGQLEEINTTGSLQGETWVDGDVLYLSPTIAGGITNIKPNASIGHIIVLGYIEYAHAVHGKIYVKIMNGWELDELHNVYINSVTNNQGLFYTSATQLWENKSISTALGYTPVNRAGDTMTGNLILNADPVTGLGAATKDYVDNLANGIDWKQSANAGTVSVLPSYTVTGSGQILTGSVNGAIPSATTDGVTLVLGNRVLVKNETSTLKPNNGIYVVTQVGNGSTPFILTRSADANISSELSEATLSISGGSTLSNTQWHCNPASTPITIGTTYIDFSQIGSGVYFGTAPISVSGNTISISQSSGSTNGYLSSTDWTTFNNKQNTLSLTTTGASGSSTLVGSTLNIPTYTLNGLGGASASTTLTINGTTYDLAANRTWSVGTFTLPSLTAGSVLFSNGTTIAQDNANFFWDDTNNRLGIGTNAPAYGLDINSTSIFRDNLLVQSANGRYVGFDGFTTGMTVDFRFGDINNRVANTYGSTMNIESYHGVVLSNSNLGSVTNAALRVLGRQSGKPILELVGGSTVYGTMFYTGNFSLGNVVDSGYRLDVTGTTRLSNTTIINAATVGGLLQIKGTGTTSSTYQIYTQNSNATKYFYVRDDGEVGASRLRGDEGNFGSGTGTQTSLVALGGSANFQVQFTSGSLVATIYNSSGGGITFKTLGAANALVITNAGAGTFASSVTATSIIKSGGTATQYLMADGSTTTLTNPVTGTGTSGQISYWSGTNTITSSSDFSWNNTSKYLVANIGLSGYVKLAQTGWNSGFIQTAYSNFIFGSNLRYDGSQWVYDQTGYGAQFQADTANGYIQLNTTISGTAGTTATIQPRLRILNDGRTLLGTSIVTDDTTSSLQVGGSGRFTGTLKLDTINAATTDTDKFLVSDSGIIKYRTGAELLSDIGGQASLTNPITGTGTTNYIAKFTGTSALGDSTIFDNGTNVGIGTISPNDKLQVSGTGNLGITISTTGNTATDYAAIRYNQGSSDIASVYTNQGNYIISTAGSERMRITSGGNVGIGVTPSAWGGTVKAIQLGTYTSLYSLANTYSVFGNNSYYNGTNDIYINTDFASMYYMYQGQHVWRIAPSGTAGVAITFTEAMKLNASGRLLLGTTTDNGTDRLQVSGSALVSTSADGAFVGTINSLAPNLSVGNEVFLAFGKNNSTNNAFSWNFKYNGAGSSSNEARLYASGSSALLTIAATGATTFSSSVTAGGITTTGSSAGYNIFRRDTNVYSGGWYSPSGSILLDMQGFGTAVTFAVTTAAATFASSVTASSLIKSGGTSAQILAADGSVITAGTNVTISGGTISASGGINGTLTTGYIPKASGTSSLSDSLIYENATSIGINTSSPNSSALLHLNSTTKGFLPPAMTSVQMMAISSPTDGLEIYKTDGFNGKYFYIGNEWQPVITGQEMIYYSGNMGGSSIPHPFSAQTAGTGSSANMFGSTTVVKSKSLPIQFNTGTTTTGYAGVNTSQTQLAYLNTNTTTIWRFVLQTPSSLSDATNTYNIAIGNGVYPNAIWNPVFTQGFGFIYSHDINAGDWTCFYNGYANRLDSNVAVAASTVYILEIEFIGGTSMKFYINGTLVNTQTTGLPTQMPNDPFFGCGIAKRAGTTLRTMYFMNVLARRTK